MRGLQSFDAPMTVGTGCFGRRGCSAGVDVVMRKPTADQAFQRQNKGRGVGRNPSALNISGVFLQSSAEDMSGK